MGCMMSRSRAEETAVSFFPHAQDEPEVPEVVNAVIVDGYHAVRVSVTPYVFGTGGFHINND